LYCEFHFAINEWIQRATDYTRELKTFITFSDSVYVISESRNAAIVFAISMMRKAFTAHVPIRIGIGYGSFTRLAFSTVHHPSGALVAQSPFLGTAVIRAYRAERCGSPGFRIFVHPSAASEDPEKAWLLLTLEEPSDHCVQEVNYVNRRPPSPGLDDLLRDLAKMRRDASGTRALRHYDETERALKRLNAAGKTHRWDFRSEGPVEEL
jgi:hypothetical protein